jgi:serine/threonine-protein kinase RsbW
MSDDRTHIPDPVVVELPHDRDRISTLIDTIIEQASDAGMQDAAAFAIRLALEEAITNAFVHGHRELDASVPVRIEYRVGAGELDVAIEDQGPGFVPEALPDPTLDENLAKPSGRGVMLMKAYMSDVAYNARGNRVVLRYRAG